MNIRCMGCMKEFKDEYKICPYCGYIVGTVSEEADQIKAGTMLFNRYLVGKVLGFGGFGITYVGWDTVSEQKVAIKEYFPRDLSARASQGITVITFSGEKNQMFQNGLNKFVAEAKLLVKLSKNEGIVKFKDFFEENQTAYIVMEYVEGITLKEYLKHQKTLTDKMTVSIMMPLMESLKEVHEQGIIHRDISPENIMLNNEQIKLIDFGAARLATSDNNRSLSIVLKHGFAPEEQYRTKGRQGAWTDIYALCATMYKCITGIVPDESFERIIEDTLKKPSELGISINPIIEKVIMKGLSVRSQDRYQNLEDMINDLREAENEDNPDYFIDDKPTEQLPVITSEMLKSTSKEVNPQLEFSDIYVNDEEGNDNPEEIYPEDNVTVVLDRETAEASVRNDLKQDDRPDDKKSKLIPILIAAAILSVIALIVFITVSSGNKKETNNSSASSSQSTVDMSEKESEKSDKKKDKTSEKKSKENNKNEANKKEKTNKKASSSGDENNYSEENTKDPMIYIDEPDVTEPEPQTEEPTSYEEYTEPTYDPTESQEYEPPVTEAPVEQTDFFE